MFEIENNISFLPHHRKGVTLERHKENIGLRKEAKEKGLKFFYTNKPCVKGHICKRYVANGSCFECHSLKAKTEKGKLLNAQYHQKHKLKRNAYQAKWKQANAEKVFANRLKVYKLTVEEYDSLLNSQNNTCAICKNEFKNKKHRHIDHCHKTGKVRGILCNKCNLSVGLLNESVQTALNLAEYLKL